MKLRMSIASFAVLVNGGPSEFFNATRGLRQGDPLSHLLFIIVMKAFNGWLCKTIDLQLVKEVLAGRQNHCTEVSHLFFVDDTLIFCQPDVRNLLNLKYVLLCFQVVFDLKINLDKSKFVRIGGNKDAGMFANMLRCKAIMLPIKYLGICLPNIKSLHLGNRSLSCFEKSLQVESVTSFLRVADLL